MKRAMDLLLVGIALPLMLPLMLAIVAIVKLQDGGSVLYRGLRVGRNGRPFRMLKFRTMIVNADTVGGASTSNRDPRITSLGAFLRRFKLDELPQLFNILKGDMSFVGPRPEVPEYVALFTDEEKEILSVRPGITDFATLWNRDEGALLATSTDPERMYLAVIRPRKIRLQLEYVRRRSLRTDAIILLRTAMGLVLRTKSPALELAEGDTLSR